MAKPPTNPKIYHIVNVDRLASITKSGGLLSDSEIIKLKLPGTTIGMGSIKARRLELPVKCYSNATVGDFVPFYFCPRSVMLYVIHKANNPELTYKGGQGPIVHLQCDLNKVIAALDRAKRSWAFSGSNAGAVYSSFWNDPSKLSQLDWSHIGAKYWQEPEVRDAKQAEFLVYKKFPWHLVDRIGVQNLATFNAVTNAIAQAAHKPTVAIETNWYY
ncbi:DUF4433 domain-containing protein [Mesorhizobium sp. B1-1-5]|uniref:type II toxin-antitoxin system toxin DNA ADP-ribosyl transferase DarT n=1 Tax=Mesorhizobium sp. B1-1-5 TaxID=2589979 RepID=UPI00112CBE43|nr:DUF4433 domain-containing protein [Mesorhizobium sp. B1-1-5]TPO08890.1 DUF4433 domain-containing protein [Mesorhizobium sp. B1-1-5]